MEVIGAGFGRTGTRTLKVALEMLGLGPCYHMVELLADPGRVGYWEDAEFGRPVDWAACLAGYRSCVDFPGYRHYKALMAAFPSARVILTERDPDEWWESVDATIYRAAPPWWQIPLMAVRMPFSPRLRGQVRCFKLAGRVWRHDFAGRFQDRPYATDVYRRHNADVRRAVPADRLLVYRVEDGWGPLCRFLDLPEPTDPFPHLNRRAEFAAMKGQLLA